MLHSLRCRWRKLSKFLSRKNPQKELQTVSPNGCHCQWLKDYLGDSGQSLVDSGIENRDCCRSGVSVLCCDIQCTVPGTSTLKAPGARAPIFCAKWPSVNRAPSDYTATCHEISHALSGPPYTCRGDRLLQLFLLNFSYELIYFRSCKLANLPNQRSSSYADNGSMSVFPCQSVTKVSKCIYCLNCPKFGQLILTRMSCWIKTVTYLLTEWKERDKRGEGGREFELPEHANLSKIISKSYHITMLNKIVIGRWLTRHFDYNGLLKLLSKSLALDAFSRSKFHQIRFLPGSAPTPLSTLYNAPQTHSFGEGTPLPAALFGVELSCGAPALCSAWGPRDG